METPKFRISSNHRSQLVTSLAIVYLLVKEGREAWAGEECGCSSGH